MSCLFQVKRPTQGALEPALPKNVCTHGEHTPIKKGKIVPLHGGHHHQRLCQHERESLSRLGVFGEQGAASKPASQPASHKMNFPDRGRSKNDWKILASLSCENDLEDMSGPAEEITTRSKAKQTQKKRGSIPGITPAVQEKVATASMESMTQALLKINQSLEALTKLSTENSKKLTELTARLDLNTASVASNTESINKLIQESSETRKIAESAKNTAEETREKLVPITKKVNEHDAALSLLELQRKEKNLKLRLVPESEGDSLVDFLTQNFSEFWQEDLQEEEFEITTAFRLGRRQGKKPRDCLITLRSKEERDKILNLHYQKALEIENSQVQIFKDIPKYILEVRAFYKDLAYLLKKNIIPFRWEFPQGLSFNFKGRKVKIRTVQDKEQFLERYQEELQKGTVETTSEEKGSTDIANLSFGLIPPSEDEQKLGAVGGTGT
ncbi:uncharacterized protein LOC144325741 isoform X2 [Podarcis muralis]